MSFTAANDTPSEADLPLDQQEVADRAHAAERWPLGARVPNASRAARPVAARSGAERVLALARKRGRAGVHSRDFDRPGETADGGRPIRRLAARIDELKGRGHWFTTRRNRDRTTTYILVRDAAAVELALRDASAPEPEPLFEPETRRGDYRDVDAA